MESVSGWCVCERDHTRGVSGVRGEDECGVSARRGERVGVLGREKDACGLPGVIGMGDAVKAELFCGVVWMDSGLGFF